MAASLHDDVFLDSKQHERTRHRASAHRESVAGKVGARQVSRWPERHRVGWDATDGCNGGAGRSVLETARDGDFIVVLARKTHERSRWHLIWQKLSSAWAWSTRFNLLRKMLRVLCGYFEHQRRVQFVEGCVAEPLKTIPSPLQVEVELLAPSHCVARCIDRSDEGVSAHF